MTGKGQCGLSSTKYENSIFGRLHGTGHRQRLIQIARFNLHHSIWHRNRAKFKLPTLFNLDPQKEEIWEEEKGRIVERTNQLSRGWLHSELIYDSSSTIIPWSLDGHRKHEISPITVCLRSSVLPNNIVLVINIWCRADGELVHSVISLRSHCAWYVWHRSLIRFPFTFNCTSDIEISTRSAWSIYTQLHTHCIAVMYRHYLVPRLSSSFTLHTLSPVSNYIFYIEHTVVIAATWNNACKTKRFTRHDSVNQFCENGLILLL